MLAVFSLDRDLRDKVSEIEARSRLVLFPIPVRFVVASSDRKSLPALDSLPHPQSGLLVGVEGQVGRFVVGGERADLRLALNVVVCVRRFREDRLLMRRRHAAKGRLSHHVLRGHFLRGRLSLHLLTEKRNVFDALQLTWVAKESGKVKIKLIFLYVVQNLMDD